MPIATAIRNWCGSSQPISCTSPFSRKGTITRPEAEGQAASLQEEGEQLGKDAAARGLRGADRNRRGKRGKRPTRCGAEQRTIVSDSRNSGADEQQRDFG